MTLRLRRGTDLERQSVVFQEGELIYITDTKDLYAGDGSTVGGVKVSNAGSPSLLTQDLNLGGYDIFGSGTVTATSFVGDGSALTGIQVNVQSGQEYDISIRGTVRGYDSSVLVDPNTGSLFGNFVGDGSLISNISISQLVDVSAGAPLAGDVLTYAGGAWTNVPISEIAITEGSNLRVNIIGADSSTIINSADNSIDASIITAESLSLLTAMEANQVLITGAGSNLTISNDNSYSLFRFIRSEPLTDISVTSPVYAYGAIKWERDDINGPADGVYMQGGSDGFKIYNLADGVTFASSNSLHFDMSGNFGIGTQLPTEKLEVAGNGAFTGTVTAASFKGSIVGDDSTTIVDAINGTISAPGYIQFGSYTTTERDLLLAANGIVIYNTTANKFQGYQNGAWINLDDGTPA